MAAISTTLLALLQTGDHLIAQDCLYGGTYDLLTKDLPKLGIAFDFVDGNDPDAWRRALRPTTKAISARPWSIWVPVRRRSRCSPAAASCIATASPSAAIT